MSDSVRRRLLADLRAAAPADVPRTSIRIDDVLDDVDHPDLSLVVVAFTCRGERVLRDLPLPRELLS